MSCFVFQFIIFTNQMFFKSMKNQQVSATNVTRLPRQQQQGVTVRLFPVNPPNIDIFRGLLKSCFALHPQVFPSFFFFFSPTSLNTLSRKVCERYRAPLTSHSAKTNQQCMEFT